MIEKSLYFQYLMPDEGDEVMERDNDFIWLDKDDLLCSVPKEKQVAGTIELVKKQIAEWVVKYGDRKCFMVIVVNPHGKSTKEERDFIAEVFPKYINALAVINHSALGRMAINLFVGLKPPTYPLKVFKDATTAKEWLKTIRLEEKWTTKNY
jgi:hypothetical protein